MDYTERGSIMAKLKVGILGAGRIAATMADTLFKMREAECWGVASRSLKKAQAFALEHGVSHAYASYEDMLKDPEIDLVYVATPHNFHHDHGKMCIAYGKPVLMEKPFCVNEKEAKDLLAYAKKHDVFITEAIWVRYMPMVATISDILKKGLIGEPRYLTANLSYAITDKERLVSPELAGGALLDVGVYAINFAYMFFGYEDILDISATAVRTKLGVDSADSITITYKDGRMAQLAASMECVSDRMGCIHGTGGYLVVENINDFQSVTVYDNEYRKVLRKKCPRQISGYEYEVKAARSALKWRKSECKEMPHKETLRIMRVMDQIRRQIGVKYPFE